MQYASKESIVDSQVLFNILEPSFCLLVGSAVSGVSSPRVPMALPIMKEILVKASKLLQGGSYDERLIAQYALSLINGPLAPLLETTKFEEFLWQIETTAGRDVLNKLLILAYACDKEEYGSNQSAISWLLEKRVCLACLTTNFDNSIELASSSLISFHHPIYPPSLPKNTEPPILLKLHGDAQSRNCVATSRAMSDAKRLASHRVLRSLIAGQTVLVLGYSGSGDVDISPHLGTSGASFLWGVQSEESPVPSFVRYRVVCDLSSKEPNQNLLLGLAELHGWQPQIVGKDHEWKQALNQWCHSLNRSTLARIIILTLYGQTGWPVVHISRFTSTPIASDDPSIDEGVACLQVSAYGPAEKAFRRAISSGNLSSSQLITATVYLGFTQWRRGELQQALNTLWWFYDNSVKPHTQEENVEIANGLRIYLEVSRDWMQLRRNLSKRRRFYREQRIDDVIKRLKSLPANGFRSDILARAVFFHLHYLVGDSVDIGEVRELFDESMNTQNWTAAEAVGRLVVSLSFWEGLRVLVKVDLQLAQRRQWNTIRKSIAALLNSVLGGWFPIILNVLDGPIFAKLVTWWRDRRYRRMLTFWNNQQRKSYNKIV